MPSGKHMEYKGHHGSIDIDIASGLIHGKIEFINDYVGFAAERADEIEKEFHEAVDDYLETCKQLGKAPDKTLSGTFNVRVSPERHKKLSISAFKNGTSINEEIIRCIDLRYKSEVPQVHIHYHTMSEEEIDLTKQKFVKNPWFDRKAQH